MQHLLESSTTSLRAWFDERGQADYRAAQVRRWLFERRAGDWEEMTDIAKQTRAELARDFRLWTTTVARHTRADDGTEKLLLDLADGGQVECVLLRDGLRRTICISTQVGCPVGCVFCASGLDGLERNLTTGEIVEQMLLLQRLLDDRERLSHVVVMGMGEPLANLNALLPALAEVTSPTGLGISSRRVTISTVGLPSAMRRLAEHEVHYRLAVSLHAPDDQLRNQLVPTAKNITLAAILQEADHYFNVSGRRLTFEYVLLAGVNDSPEHASRLARLLGRRLALLNVIPYNPVPGLLYRTPSSAVKRRFGSILAEHGIEVKFRHRKGSKINAACGQLRRQAAETGSARTLPS